MTSNPDCPLSTTYLVTLTFFLLSNPIGWVILAFLIRQIRRENEEWRRVAPEFERRFRETYGVECDLGFDRVRRLCQKGLTDD
jgi:hypothetical protein